MDIESINGKIRFLRSDSNLKSGRPDIPVAIAIQEAYDLYEWCQPDKETLIKAGLDRSLVDDLNVRAKVLNELQSIWYQKRNFRDESVEKWKDEFAKACELRKNLLHDYKYVFSNDPEIISEIRYMTKGRSNAEFIQSLCDLSALGKLHRKKLELKGIDLIQVDKAWETGTGLMDVYSRATIQYRDRHEGTEIRNKAYYHLKEAVDRIRSAGQYVFIENPIRKRGYISEFKRIKKRKSKNKREII
jgi:hypothetical protein